MQPTTLNKIISLFLVGGLVILGGIAVLLHQLGTDALRDQLENLSGAGGQGLLAVAGGLLLLPVAAFAGAACEGLTALTIREFVKWLSKQPWGIRFFLQKRNAFYLRFWEARFLEAARESPRLAGFPLGINDQGLAVGVVFNSNAEEALRWIESHYSTYILVTNFAVLTLVTEGYLLLAHHESLFRSPGFWWGTLGMVASFYAFVALSMDKYFYSYQIAFRQAIVILQGQEGRPPGSVPGPVRRLVTENLILRPVQSEDRTALIRLLCDPNVMQKSMLGPALSPYEAERRLSWSFASEGESLFPKLGALQLKSSGEVIGVAGCLPCGYLHNERDFEIIVILDPIDPASKEEYARQIGRELLQLGLKTLCVRRILATCDPSDGSARNLLKHDLAMRLARRKQIPGRGKRAIFVHEGFGLFEGQEHLS